VKERVYALPYEAVLESLRIAYEISPRAYFSTSPDLIHLVQTFILLV
jgi:hypothetical protein